MHSASIIYTQIPLIGKGALISCALLQKRLKHRAKPTNGAQFLSLMVNRATKMGSVCVKRVKAVQHASGPGTPVSPKH